MNTDDFTLSNLAWILAKGVGAVAAVLGVVVLVVAIFATRARARAYGKLS